MSNPWLHEGGAAADENEDNPVVRKDAPPTPSKEATTSVKSPVEVERDRLAWECETMRAALSKMVDENVKLKERLEETTQMVSSADPNVILDLVTLKWDWPALYRAQTIGQKRTLLYCALQRENDGMCSEAIFTILEKVLKPSRLRQVVVGSGRFSDAPIAQQKLVLDAIQCYARTLAQRQMYKEEMQWWIAGAEKLNSVTCWEAAGHAAHRAARKCKDRTESVKCLSAAQRAWTAAHHLSTHITENSFTVVDQSQGRSLAELQERSAHFLWMKTVCEEALDWSTDCVNYVSPLQATHPFESPPPRMVLRSWMLQSAVNKRMGGNEIKKLKQRLQPSSYFLKHVERDMKELKEGSKQSL
jgi:hypothetical protein